VEEHPGGATKHQQGLPPRSAAFPAPPERHVDSERLFHSSRVFIRSFPRVRSGRARETRKTHVPGGAPRAASRALRWRGGPQKPLPARLVAPTVCPSLPGNAPRRANSPRSKRSRRPGLPFRAPHPFLAPGPVPSPRPRRGFPRARKVRRGC
jgi:hypothetical protein